MGGWPVGYLHDAAEELNSGLPRTNPDSGRAEDLNQGPPDFKSSALNHSATPPPATLQDSARVAKCFYILFVFVHTVIRAREDLTSLDKKLYAVEFYFYLMEKLFLHEKSCTRISLYWRNELNKEITLVYPYFLWRTKSGNKRQSRD